MSRMHRKLFASMEEAVQINVDVNPVTDEEMVVPERDLVEDTATEIDGSVEASDTVSEVTDEVGDVLEEAGLEHYNDSHVPMIKKALAASMSKLQVEGYGQEALGTESLVELRIAMESIHGNLVVSQETLLNRISKKFGDFFTHTKNSIKNSEETAKKVVADIEGAPKSNTFHTHHMNYLHFGGKTDPEAVISAYKALTAATGAAFVSGDNLIKGVSKYILDELSKKTNMIDELPGFLRFVLEAVAESKGHGDKAVVGRVMSDWGKNTTLDKIFSTYNKDARKVNDDISKTLGGTTDVAWTTTLKLRGDDTYDQKEVKVPSKKQLQDMVAAIGKYQVEYAKSAETSAKITSALNDALDTKLTALRKQGEKAKARRLNNVAKDGLFAMNHRSFIDSVAAQVYKPAMDTARVGHKVTRSLVGYIEVAAKQYK